MFSRYDAFGAALRLDLDVDPACPITSDMSGQDVAKVMLARSHLKKREDWPKSMIATQSTAALNLFLESNTACEGWQWNPVHVMDDWFCGELKSFLHDLCDPQHDPDLGFDLSQLIARMEPGPGAARGANSDNFYTKLFESPLTATSGYLMTLYRSAVVECPFWAEAESNRHLKYGLTTGDGDSCSVVPGSTWFSVPKSQEIQRACATEPNINMLFQKALGRWLEDRLRSTCGIDVQDQQFLNQSLARTGSISGLFGTIDLKSASDRNSMAMIEKFFPPMFVKWVKLFRSPYCRLPDGSEVKMEMCSSMGNGFTFPLQTALFVGVVATVYKMLDIPFIRNRALNRQLVNKSLTSLSGPLGAGETTPFSIQTRKAPGNFGVFGDDIIVKQEAYEICCHYLRLLGHIVNDQKSFNTGGFRESCGADFFHGYNVRGVYISSLKTPLDVYSTINRLTVWSARHGVNLSLTMQLLLGWVKFLPVPFCAADIEGIKVPYDESRPVRIKRSDRQVGADARDWQCLVYRGVAVSTRAFKVEGLSKDWESPLATNGFASNQAGWAVSALAGYCGTPPYRVDEPKPDVVIGLRPSPDEPIRWKVKLKTTPYWDLAPKLPGPVFGTDRGGAWESVAGRHEFLYLLTRV